MMGEKVIAKNKKAFYEYEILDKLEAGISLLGTEVKSIRDGRISLGEGWIDFDDNDAPILKDVHISHYSHGNINNHPETRERPLLLKRREITKLINAVDTKGLTIVPIKVYLKGQLVKVEIATARGKKLYDKRETSKKKTANREMERVIRNR